MDRDTEFGEFVDARALVMRRTAYLLCGDWHRAEDIVQASLIKLYVAWSRVRKDSVDAYARKVLVRTAIDETRRGFFQRERAVDVVPEIAVTDQTSDPDLKLALDALPPGQRAVVVLRYWEDLSVTETARILGRTEGTVKSQASKGLAALRELLENEPASRIQTSEVIRKGRTKLARRRTAIATAMAFVVLAGLGTIGHLSSSQPWSGSDVSGAVDQNEELTRILRNANIIPAGVTANDVSVWKALNFYSFDQTRYAISSLTDAKGASGLTITVTHGSPRAPRSCEGPPWNMKECRIDQVDGITVASSLSEETGNTRIWVVRAYRPDGTQVQIMSDNIGEFMSSELPGPAVGAPTNRPEPILTREALIKIATLPGLTF